MGRPKAGSSSGSRSSGSRSSSRSSGGHRMGSSSAGRPAGSSRPAGGSRTGTGGGWRPSPPPMPPRHGGYGTPPPPPPMPPRRCRYGYGGYGGSPVIVTGGRSVLSAAVSIVVAFFLLFLLIGLFADDPVTKSTHAREKLSGVSWNADCVVDERDWIEDAGATARGLSRFYDRTGVQPFVYIKAYDPSLATDHAKQEWAVSWYDAHKEELSEGAFAYFYFSDDPDTEDAGEIGYMCYVNGRMADSVMDAEAVDIFWDYLDRYWATDLSMDNVLVETFADTGERIMAVQTTGMDVLKPVAIGFAALCAAGGLVWVIRARRKAERERNEETERILNTDIRQDL